MCCFLAGCCLAHERALANMRLRNCLPSKRKKKKCIYLVVGTVRNRCSAMFCSILVYWMARVRVLHTKQNHRWIDLPVQILCPFHKCVLPSTTTGCLSSRAHTPPTISTRKHRTITINGVQTTIIIIAIIIINITIIIIIIIVGVIVVIVVIVNDIRTKQNVSIAAIFRPALE